MVSQRGRLRQYICFLIALSCSVSCFGQKSVACHIEYENQNQVDYGSQLRVSVSGVVTDPNSVPVPNACVAVFTEDGHHFVSGITSDSNGKFRLPLLKDGAYRLVVKAEGFGVANMKFRKVPETRADPILHVHMLVRAIDVTSYIDSK